MSWYAHLRLEYVVEAERTVARFRHEGPLRILQSLYPEGPTVCHHVLVHPPGGLVGGDALEMDLRVGPQAHGLITTPGATRFYRSAGEGARQRTRLTLAAGARLEWLPLETLCYDGCEAENQLVMQLEPGAELIGWDVTALGLPESGLPFRRGQLLQHLEWPGVWLERARIRASDTRLLDGPLGLAGRRCWASAFFVSGLPLARERRAALIEAARAVIAVHALAPTAGATSPNPHVVAVRVLAEHVEPAMALLQGVRAAWRSCGWSLPAVNPRTWAM